MISVIYNKQEQICLSVATVGMTIAEELQKKQISGKILAFRDIDTGELIDLQQLIQGPATITPIFMHDDAYIQILRHDCEHVLAQAVQKLFPDVKVSIGADMHNGFGYDFHTATPFSIDDLEKIENKMREIIAEKIPIVREVWSIAEAIEYFTENDEIIKEQLLCSLESKGYQNVTVYKQGDFLDLCRGPHGINTGDIPLSFKLMKVSAAQWSMDKTLPIQRITGILMHTKEELDAYLANIAAAKDRDHRKLAMQMDLYHIAEHSPGLPLWHPNGWTIIETLKKYMRSLLKADEYMEVNTPGLFNAQLWQKSGHWEVFKQNMFCIHCHDDQEDSQEYALKPMSCPAHIEIFKSHFLGGVKSYNTLPLRISEFGEVYRNESTGALHGLKRVRKLTQDDGHIFCTKEQIKDEIIRHCLLFKKVYSDLGFTKYSVDLSTRPDERLGDESLWDQAEHDLAEGAHCSGFEFKIAEGEGAFYGPKLDFHIADSLDRQWQCCTLQLDFVLPKRLEAEYIDSEGKKKYPVMIHRAIFGSLERFLAILLENTAGFLPMWLAPVQVVVVPMNLDMHEEGKKITKRLNDLHDNMRVKIDCNNESLNKKIRMYTEQRAIYMLIVGKKEIENNTLSLRCMKTGEQITLPTEQIISKLEQEAMLPKK